MKETLKLALEALERLHYEMFTQQGEKAITAIKEALAQPEQEPVAWKYELKNKGSFAGVSTEYSRIKLDKIGQNWMPLYTTPPHPQSEARGLSQSKPLTADRKWKLTNAFWRMYGHGKNDNPVSAQCEVQALGMFLSGTDMTAWKTTVVPPKNVGKPLTDEQIDDLCRTMVKGNKSVNWLCREIEAAHGIK